MMLREWLGAALLTAAIAGTGAAQARPTAGDRVRVTSEAARVVGTLRLWSADSVVVEDGHAVAGFRLADVGLVERQIGTRGRFLHGVAVGALVGGLVGGTVGVAAGEDSCSQDAWLCFSRGTIGLVFGILGVGAGVVVGGVAGALSHQPVWETAYRGGQRTAFSVAPVVTPGAVGVGVSMSFR